MATKKTPAATNVVIRQAKAPEPDKVPVKRGPKSDVERATLSARIPQPMFDFYRDEAEAAGVTMRTVVEEVLGKNMERIMAARARKAGKK